jgi:hypothetical protein
MRYISLGGGLLGAIAIGAVCQPAEAQVTDSPAPASAEPAAGADTATLREELDAMRAREQQARDQIEVLEQRLTALEQILGGGGVPLSPEQEMAMRGRGMIVTGVTPRYSGEYVEALGQSDGQAGGPVAGASASTAQAAEGGEEDVRREPAPAESVEAVTRDTQGYFGERFGVELGVTYGHFDDARINLSGFLALDAIFLGLISIDEQTSDIVTADLTFRYAPSNRIQFDVDVPYLYRSSTYQSGGAGGDASGLAQEKVTDNGVGDISGGISYRLIPESVGFPDVVINGRVKAPTGRDPFGVELREVPGTEGNLKVPTSLSTGTGTWAASGGISMLKTVDPMIVFGNLTYFHNFTQNFADIDEATGNQPGRISIGDAIQAGAGVAFALNEFSSLSTSFSLRFGDETRLRHTNDENWRTVVGSASTVGILNLGATFAVSRKASILANIGVGVTEDAPDMTLSVRVPYRF